MITTLAESTHENRVRALKDDDRVAVPIHEAGHVVMARLHRVDVPVKLPTLNTDDGSSQIAHHAEIQFHARGLYSIAITDICFGGYSGELALYDKLFLNLEAANFFVNGTRAANDCIVFINEVGKNPATARELEKRLRSGGELAGKTVRALFQQYGTSTYDKMRESRKELISIAQDIFVFWKSNDFKSCKWRRSENPD
jgi:hypothetical protein